MIFENNKRKVEIRENEGQGISSIIVEYYLSTSKDTLTGGNWQSTEPQREIGKYIWTRCEITYKNPTLIAYSAPICVDIEK